MELIGSKPDEDIGFQAIKKALKELKLPPMTEFKVKTKWAKGGAFCWITLERAVGLSAMQQVEITLRENHPEYYWELDHPKVMGERWRERRGFMSRDFYVIMSKKD